MKATAIANSNIAFLKYWGKKDEDHNIPMNPSISMTLDETVSTKTTVEFSDNYKEDLFFFDNEKQEGEKLRKVSAFLDLIRKKANKNIKAKVFSINTFPTGSGIASSASGFAALAAASAKASTLNLNEKELSSLARQGSGSACRSIFGGFVEWDKEYSSQIKDEKHWPEIRDIIVIVSKEEKKISSREGMRMTVATSPLYKKRIASINVALFKIRRAIMNKDFPTLAETIMKESDNLHDCMADTTPKLIYMNEDSNKIKAIVKEMNAKLIKAAYSFDAGSNAHIITLEKYIPEILIELKRKNYLSYIISKSGKGIKYSEEHLF